MKKFIYRFLVNTLLLLGVSNASATVIHREINQGWKFRQARLENWYSAKVPGVVHTDLIDNKIIEDPFFRLNERAVQWVDKEDWIYQTVLQGENEILSCNNQWLRFKGLDTYADVYLNNQLVLKADNMFREWNVNVKGILKAGENVLKIYFHSPIKIDMPKWEALPYQMESGNDQSANGGLLDRKVGVFARKAGYHYGWDWGPRLVTSGIWRPVYLEGWDNVRIENVQLIQNKVDKNKALLTSVVTVESDKEMANASVTVIANGKKLASSVQNLKQGINKVTLNYTMNKPTLWWTNGLGKPYLYDFETKVECNGEIEDLKAEKIGVRSLKLITNKDATGRTLYFELNGKPVFMKGANYIPCDNFLNRVTDSVYQRTILDAKNANMNMLRVWGGGTYEEDKFYDLCDKNGILVWQDFMFACSLYPDDKAYMDNVRQEAIDNVKRLRNHASIALWCGNNECQDGWFGWGWKTQYEKMGKGIADRLWKGFQNLYYNVLADVVTEMGGGISYRASSPMAFPDGKSDGVNGDSHYWGVWHGNHPIDQYNKERSRFFSEYGFQSFPEYESVKIYAPEERDHNIYSEVMMAHQRGGTFANRRIEEYMLKGYNKPKDFEHFLYTGMILQGDAIKTAMEAHRRDMPYCMGSLFWQHNDCWPVASWSSRDYYGRWKAQHYYAKKAYDMILISPYIKGDTVQVSLVSDFLTPVKGKLNIEVMTLDGKVLFSWNKSWTAKANKSEVVFEKMLNTLIKNEKKGNVIVYTSFSTEKELYENVGYAVMQKEMGYTKPNITYKVEPTKGGFNVTLSSDVFARGVFLSLKGISNFFEDNYFDLLPKHSVTKHVESKLSLDEFQKQLKITCLADSYM